MYIDTPGFCTEPEVTLTATLSPTANGTFRPTIEFELCAVNEIDVMALTRSVVLKKLIVPVAEALDTTANATIILLVTDRKGPRSEELDG